MVPPKTEASKKRLTVSFEKDPREPNFKFEGVWTGFDISTVSSNLRRAYLHVKRDQRRADVRETSNVSAKGESE